MVQGMLGIKNTDNNGLPMSFLAWLKQKFCFHTRMTNQPVYVDKQFADIRYHQCCHCGWLGYR